MHTKQVRDEMIFYKRAQAERNVGKSYAKNFRWKGDKRSVFENFVLQQKTDNHFADFHKKWLPDWCHWLNFLSHADIAHKAWQER